MVVYQADRRRQEVSNESEQNDYWVKFQSKKLKMLEEELKLEKGSYM
ncbi:6455_t:CDS:2 [Entrophospora sp. SA101]|nr:6455_t:CDS:2 [Entrophospora sp. SA101]CAJ0832127.1 3231_t:CDS:2 [Entrophospora sp. SA101]CAJ0836850.1 2822_t:CDS:2 [Entrophospora sp. SA101]